MKFLTLILILGLSGLWVACSDSDGDGTPPVETTDPAAANATAVNEASSALASIADLVSTSSLSQRAGTANSHCTATGSPKDNGGSDMTSADAGYQSALGYCQGTFNSVSPDTVRGSMAIAGGLICEAQRNDAFDGVDNPGDTNTVENGSATFDTTCWGSSDDVAALTAEMGTNTISGIRFTVTEVSADTSYTYKVDYTLGSDSTSVYVYNSGTESAALSSEGWAFQMDTATGTIRFEGIDSENSRRNRMLVVGTLGSSGAFTSLTSISGFQTQGTALSTYNGNLSGLIGDYYDGNSGATNDRTAECYIQTSSSPSCGSTVALAGASDTAATDLSGDLSALETALTSDQSARLGFSTVDLSDLDLTD